MGSPVLTPETLRSIALEEGLDLVGTAPAGPSPSWSAYRDWLVAGYAADMTYLARPDAVDRRRDPRVILPTARTVLVVAASYAGPPLPPLARLHGRVARYAWGPPPDDGIAAEGRDAASRPQESALERPIASDEPRPQKRQAGSHRGPISAGETTDYHSWLLARLRRLVDRIAAELSSAAEDGTTRDEHAANGRPMMKHPFASRLYVDTGPILERAWAQAAGLGWAGKNTNLIHPRLGSYLLLGVALLSVPLPPTPPEPMPSCGTCTRCIDACPTGAIVAPGVIDARRCLAYLTIEHRGPIPEALRPALGDRIFGCDVCQEVCPWTRRALTTHANEVAPPDATLALPKLLTLDKDTFRARFRHTPVWRATPEGLARNAAIVLGNLRDPAARPTLIHAAAAHPSPIVRDHVAWALEQLDRAA